MRTVTTLTLPFAILAALAACGGSDPAPAPEAAPAVEEKAPAAAEEPPAEEAPAAEEEAAEPDFASLSDEDKLAQLMELGETVYTTGGSGGVACVTCHQANGAGLPPSFPPLAGSKDNMGDCKTHAGYVVHGLKGELEVQGTTYNGVMPAQGNLSDMEIASVITYERMSWGNDYGPCMPEDVAAAR